MSKVYFDKFSAVVPAYNEASRCGKVIEELLKIGELDELLFIDDGSTDKTARAVRPFMKDPRFVYIRHQENKGKGAALQTGMNAARNEVIFFCDADLSNITANKIKKIVAPVLRDQVDVSRASFTRRRGRVTEYAVKPMMQILFPDHNFKQPITGQVCAKKEFLEKISLENQYGVDIGILFDAIGEGQKIVEVDIGELKHKANSEKNITEMSRQVLETMIRKAGLIQHKYKLIIFSLDETLIRRSNLKNIYAKIFADGKLEALQKLHRQGKISFGKLVKAMARKCNGLKISQIEDEVNKAPLTPYAQEVIETLLKRKYKVGIISSNLSPIVNCIAKRLAVDKEAIDCIYLEQKNGILTGKISGKSLRRWFDSDDDITFQRAFKRILRLHGVKPLETIMIANSPKSIPLQNSAGLSVAYKPTDKNMKTMADKTISVLAEILAIVE